MGVRLKLAQRDRPLIRESSDYVDLRSFQSVNAHFNIEKLAISDKYLVNFYGEDTTSFPHIGSDRLWVWESDTSVPENETVEIEIDINTLLRETGRRRVWRAKTEKPSLMQLVPVLWFAT
jgi:predicted GNAT superfamily acetyltransferase